MAEAQVAALDVATADAGIAAEPQPAVDAEAPAKPKRTRRKKADEVTEAVEAPAAEPVAAEAPTEDAAKPKRRSRAKAATTTAEPAPVTQDLAPAVSDGAAAEAEAEAPEDEGGEPRRGWWQRTFGA